MAFDRFVFTKHALAEAERRIIPSEVVERVLDEPQQIVPANDDLQCFQSKVPFPNGRHYLVRVFVLPEGPIAKVITVYRTSKIQKYWRHPS